MTKYVVLCLARCQQTVRAMLLGGLALLRLLTVDNLPAQVRSEADSLMTTPPRLFSLNEAYRQKAEERRRYFEQLGFPELPAQPELSPLLISAPAIPATPAVQADYRLGAGDEIGIFLIGEMQREFRSPIHADGTVFVPPVGTISLQHLTLAEARNRLDAALQRYFANYRLHVSVLRARTVRVEVAGEVLAPGAYTVSGVQSLFDVLGQAGSLSPQGSWRSVRIETPGRPAASVDLYAMLFDSTAPVPVYLQSGARVLVPPHTAWVAVHGDVVRPGIYQLPVAGGERVNDMLHWAGGVYPTTDSAYVQLSRFGNDGRRELLTIDLSQAGETELRHGDIVRAFPRIIIEQRARIGVWGEVQAPGYYPYAAGLRVSDAIRLGGGLKRNADWQTAHLVYAAPTARDSVVQVNLERALAHPRSAGDPLLGPDDQVFVREQAGWSLDNTVKIVGEVHHPGVYSIEKNGTHLSEIIRLAGGPTERALLRGARLYRATRPFRKREDFERLSRLAPEQMSKLEYESFLLQVDVQALDEVVVNIEAMLSEPGGTSDPMLTHGDVIEVPEIPNVVYVAGRVGRPGGIPFQDGAAINYYLDKAGKTTWDAARGNIRVVRVSGQIEPAGKVKQPERGDIIWVPRRRDRSTWAIIRDTVVVLAQLATIYLVIDNTRKN